jgi:hypothetical protein
MQPTHKILTTLTAQQRPHPPRITPFRYNACRDPTVLQRAVRAIKRRRRPSRGLPKVPDSIGRIGAALLHGSPPPGLTDPASLEVSVAVNCDLSSQNCLFLAIFSMEARISCEV